MTYQCAMLIGTAAVFSANAGLLTASAATVSAVTMGSVVSLRVA